LQDEQEEIDNVQVKVESSKDVFLRRQRVLVLASHHHLRVKHYVATED